MNKTLLNPVHTNMTSLTSYPLGSHGSFSIHISSPEEWTSEIFFSSIVYICFSYSFLRISFLHRCGYLTFHIVLPFSFLHYPYIEAAIRATYHKNICNCSVSDNIRQYTASESAIFMKSLQMLIYFNSLSAKCQLLHIRRLWQPQKLWWVHRREQPAG